MAIAKTGFGRVFIIDGRARPDHAPVYQDCMKAGAVSQSFGETSSIECPSSAQYDQFDEVDTIKSAEERPTLSLTGRYAADVASTLLAIAKRGCEADVQVHYGSATDPTAFNKFTKSLVLDKAAFATWSTEDLTALASDERAGVNETADLSGKEIFEILPMTLASAAGSIVTNEVLDVVICDSPACADSLFETTGCYRVYAITKAAGGSPGTPPDVVHTIDGGGTWYADDIDSLGAAEDPSAIGCVGDYVVVVSNASTSLHYASQADIDDVDLDETWTEVATGFVQGPNDCFRAKGGGVLFIVGDGGYVYSTRDPASGVDVLSAGAAVTDDLRCVHALSDTMALAGGDAGALIWTQDGTTWSEVTSSPVGAGVSIYCCWMKDEYTWLVGTSNGNLYYTVNQGADWTAKGFAGSGTGRVDDIFFANNSVGYLAHATTTPAGRIFRTYDGGYSWQALPESVGTIPANDRINAVSGCYYDVNFLVGVGLADDGADGVVIVGND